MFLYTKNVMKINIKYIKIIRGKKYEKKNINITYNEYAFNFNCTIYS
ncbi:protein of unknown function [Tepidibacter aestuarii]|nr:protein of unknown function [Tepidibacter aestuarii]